MNPNMHPLIADLRRAWIASGLTLGDIATLMDRPANYATNLSRLLAGKHQPTLGHLTELADILGYDIGLIPQRRKAA